MPLFGQRCLAGGDQHQRVVGGGVAVHSDAVERTVGRLAYHRLQQQRWRDFRVCGDVAQHGRHVRVDHA